jgi:hypothetical protein
MHIDLNTPIRQLKLQGQFPVPWTSAIGLIPHIRGLGDSVTGCELGVSFGLNLVCFLDDLPNLKKVYAIDPYLPYQDGPSVFVTEEAITKTMNVFLDNISEYQDRVTVIRKTADDAVNDISDGELDYIFIDGDHSYGAVQKDMANYYSKVRSGGIFAGHDYSWPGVRQAVAEFISANKINVQLLHCANDVWFWVKP